MFDDVPPAVREACMKLLHEMGHRAVAHVVKPNPLWNKALPDLAINSDFVFIDEYIIPSHLNSEQAYDYLIKRGK
jgi:hypothetical protein